MSTETIALLLRDTLSLFGSDPELAIARLGDLYDEDVTFADPIQTVHGRQGFLDMNRRLLAKTRVLRFDVSDTSWTRDRVFLNWKFTMQPKVGPNLEWEGISDIRVRDGKVIEHHDYFDFAGGMLRSLPLVGRLYQAVLSKIG